MQTNGASLTPEDIQAHAARLEAESAEHCAGLRKMLESEQQLRSSLQSVLDASAAREKRLAKALAALEGSVPAAPAKPAKHDPNKHGWKVSDEKVEEVYGWIVKAIETSDDGATTLTRARELAGSTSGETYRKAVMALREQERIRVAGKTRGGGLLLALMPGADVTPRLEDQHAAA